MPPTKLDMDSMASNFNRGTTKSKEIDNIQRLDSTEHLELQKELEEKKVKLLRERGLREEALIRLRQTEKENLQLREYLNTILMAKLRQKS